MPRWAELTVGYGLSTAVMAIGLFVWLPALLALPAAIIYGAILVVRPEPKLINHTHPSYVTRGEYRELYKAYHGYYPPDEEQETT